MVRAGLLAGGIAAFLAGCTQDSAPTEEQPIPVEESVFGDQVQTMDRAREVGTLNENRMRDLNQKLEEGEGTKSDDKAD
jgi:hypothetical protein